MKHEAFQLASEVRHGKLKHFVLRFCIWAAIFGPLWIGIHFIMGAN